MRSRLSILISLALSCSSATTSVALAQTSENVSLAALFGYGLSFEDDNPWAGGLGLSAGYNIGKAYVGARFVYQFGGTPSENQDDDYFFGGGGALNTTSYEFDEFDDSYDSDSEFGSGDTKSSLWQLGLTGGYDLSMGRAFTLRPCVGFGVASVTSDEKHTAAYLSAGATGLYAFSDRVFGGADLQLQALFIGRVLPGLVLMLTGGVRI